MKPKHVVSRNTINQFQFHEQKMTCHLFCSWARAFLVKFFLKKIFFFSKKSRHTTVRAAARAVVPWIYGTTGYRTHPWWVLNLLLRTDPRNVSVHGVLKYGEILWVKFPEIRCMNVRYSHIRLHNLVAWTIKNFWMAINHTTHGESIKSNTFK